MIFFGLVASAVIATSSSADAPIAISPRVLRELYNNAGQAADGWETCLDERDHLVEQLETASFISDVSSQSAPQTSFWGDAGLVLGGALIGVLLGASITIAVMR